MAGTLPPEASAVLLFAVMKHRGRLLGHSRVSALTDSERTHWHTSEGTLDDKTVINLVSESELIPEFHERRRKLNHAQVALSGKKAELANLISTYDAMKSPEAGMKSRIILLEEETKKMSQDQKEELEAIESFFQSHEPTIYIFDPYTLDCLQIK